MIYVVREFMILLIAKRSCGTRVPLSLLQWLRIVLARTLRVFCSQVISAQHRQSQTSIVSFSFIGAEVGL